MGGDSSAYRCPKCRNKMLWNGTVYRCIACDCSVPPKPPKRASPKSPKPRRER